MASVRFTKGLRDEYEQLFCMCQLRSERFDEVDNLVETLLRNRDRYQGVADELGFIPWFVIAVIHHMEASQRFDLHLHNGDPLTAQTVRIPQNRPRFGQPPFTWEESAMDALRFARLHRCVDWSLAGTLYRLEGFNGWGYRQYHPEVLSPYLWSFSNHYDSGKYIADGRWSHTAVSDQCGAAVLLRRMVECGQVTFDTAPPEHILRFSATGVLPYGGALQEFLNSLPNIHLRVDGWPGEKTSTAFRTVSGFFLKGDPRGE